MCVERLDAQAQHGQFGAMEHKVAHREAPRRAGDVDRLSATLYDLDPDRRARPWSSSAGPPGRAARSSSPITPTGAIPRRCEAILWGASAAAGRRGAASWGAGSG